jgi:hypothetical protein
VHGKFTVVEQKVALAPKQLSIFAKATTVNFLDVFVKNCRHYDVLVSFSDQPTNPRSTRPNVAAHKPPIPTTISIDLEKDMNGCAAVTVFLIAHHFWLPASTGFTLI